MDRWPTVEDLADAATEDVLGEWSGLGYNARALRLHSAAEMVVENGWPTTVEGLSELPGVGPYTANAIASISFGVQVAAVDTNLRRVLSRWNGEPLDGRPLTEFAKRTLGVPAGDWNQAVMDIGSELCTPRDPSCAVCPVSDFCADPSIYVPPTRQSRFEGSNRQLRGALVRAHLEGRDLIRVGEELGRRPDEITSTISTLTDEGLLPDV
jgi:A/G-specific adenine glycosylase